MQTKYFTVTLLKCSHDYDVEWFYKNVELAMHKVHTQYTTATGGSIV